MHFLTHLHNEICRDDQFSVMFFYFWFHRQWLKESASLFGWIPFFFFMLMCETGNVSLVVWKLMSAGCICMWCIIQLYLVYMFHSIYTKKKTILSLFRLLIHTHTQSISLSFHCISMSNIWHYTFCCCCCCVFCSLIVLYSYVFLFLLS